MSEKKKVSTFAKRFAAVMEETGATAKDLSMGLGVSLKTVYSWKSGERSPKPPAVVTIANLFGIAPEWLEGYDVDKRPPGEPKISPARTVEARMISHGVDAMPPEQRERALSMFRLMFEQYADLFDAEDNGTLLTQADKENFADDDDA